MEKDKDGEGSWGSPDTRPSFFQIMWSDNLKELKIPTKFFDEHLATEETETVALRSPCGSWDTKLEQRDGGVYLIQGWPHFVESHDLGRAEWAHFLYNGGMSFDVKIYGSNGWLKKYDQPAASAPPFASSFPFFRREIKRYNVGHKCSMVIPTHFSRWHMSLSKEPMVLMDSDGVSWPVTITVTSGNRLAMTGGWKALADARSIKKGDVCIFELVEKRVMKFHVLR
ncbi:B3 domain-containing protein REM6-like [Salvia hispanica]|uniref:B3 domain-containing protein REM6-like n=1 Tax=Salvia hispanica TaxID=49212 RepID=UPI0020099020|nr:B3 domain-containing protein REM6-like [Salvia hispanica]XP_047938905.1 B3 domain-containing protein REM6-like [Salvia hispanica]XP_047938906.1 B3 domain-containing protein REM6-like [Salvia hispanica]